MALFSKKQKKEPQNLKEILAEFEELKGKFRALSDELAALKTANIKNLKKIAVVRFNPFNEIGGNQSFSLAILDDENNGAVITSLFTRNENRVYGKPIKNGSSEFTLTNEEKEAIAFVQRPNSKLKNQNGK